MVQISDCSSRCRESRMAREENGKRKKKNKTTRRRKEKEHEKLCKQASNRGSRRNQAPRSWSSQQGKLDKARWKNQGAMVCVSPCFVCLACMCVLVLLFLLLLLPARLVFSLSCLAFPCLESALSVRVMVSGVARTNLARLEQLGQLILIHAGQRNSAVMGEEKRKRGSRGKGKEEKKKREGETRQMEERLVRRAGGYIFGLGRRVMPGGEICCDFFSSRVVHQNFFFLTLPLQRSGRIRMMPDLPTFFLLFCGDSRRDEAMSLEESAPGWSFWSRRPQSFSQ